MFYADAIQRNQTAPKTLGDIPTLVGTPVFGDDGGDDDSGGAQGGRLILIVKRNGGLRTLAWEYFPIATPLANAMVRATQAADSAGEFDGIERPYDVSYDDTHAVDIRSFLETEPVQFPLVRARLASYRGELLAAVLKQGRMVYPPSAARARVGTQGEVRYIVEPVESAPRPRAAPRAGNWQRRCRAPRRGPGASVVRLDPGTPGSWRIQHCPEQFTRGSGFDTVEPMRCEEIV